MKANKITFLHEWLCQNGGSEKVLAKTIKLFPQQEKECVVMFQRENRHKIDPVFSTIPIQKSLINYLPFIEHLYRVIIPISIFTQRFIKIRDTDLIISSSHAIIKGIKKPADTLHICYCHTPMRYIWDMYSDYYQSANFLVKIFMKLAVNFLQKWDVDSVKNVDYFIANSEFVKKRILNFYKKDATVIYPPVDNIFFRLNQNPRQDDYYLFIGRLVPYKRVDLAIEAFKKLTNKKLVIVGDGFLAEKVRKEIIDFPNISYLGFQSEENLLQLIQQAKACIFAAKEDFGIGCVESQFCGTPVIALRYGGYLETVTEGLSGYFFNEQSVDSLTATLHHFEKKPLVNHTEISNSVAKFAQQNFDESILTFIEKKYNEFYSTK